MSFSPSSFSWEALARSLRARGSARICSERDNAKGGGVLRMGARHRRKAPAWRAACEFLQQTEASMPLSTRTADAAGGEDAMARGGGRVRPRYRPA